MGPNSWLCKGQEVEVAGDEEGLRGAWYEATVARSFPSKGKVSLLYRTLALDDDPTKPLKETVDAARVRPAPPPIDGRGRAGPVVFGPGQAVDAFYNEGWWVGTVSEVRVTDDKGGPVRTLRYRVRFPDPVDEREFGVEELRVHLEWVGGEWVSKDSMGEKDICITSEDVNWVKQFQKSTAKEVDVPLISLLTDAEDETITKSLSDTTHTKSKRVKTSSTRAKVEHMRPSRKKKKNDPIEDNSRLLDWLNVSRTDAATPISEEKGKFSVEPPLSCSPEKSHIKKRRSSRSHPIIETPSNASLQESDNESPLQNVTMVCALPALKPGIGSPKIMEGQTGEEKGTKKRARKPLQNDKNKDSPVEGNSTTGEDLNNQSVSAHFVVEEGKLPSNAFQRLQSLTAQAFDNVKMCYSNSHSGRNPNLDVQNDIERNYEQCNSPLQPSIVQVEKEFTSVKTSVVAVPFREGSTPMDTSPLDSPPLPVLPFKKKSPVWKVIDSMEIFSKRPQHPHFCPLLEIPELYREGSAISQMVTFSTLVDGIYKLQFEDSKVIIEDQLKALTDLEKHGFDLQPERSFLNSLLGVKDKCEVYEDQINTLEEKVHEEKQKNESLDKEVVAVDDQLVELQNSISMLIQKKASLLNQREMNTSNVDKLLDEIGTMKGAMLSVKCEFQKIVGEKSSKKAL
ncbi:hypothetical protein QJS10_CPA09g00747 [Acorus calamus]|uniref:Agenet domain-containing protein n=1 Tax=Acorus calamus TaxID=4465 RepID=A0AAV9E381_ACOCL|nr:hypothetical protein QJS10_CPA09g00747 [Acorus calamus]